MNRIARLQKKQSVTKFVRNFSLRPGSNSSCVPPGSMHVLCLNLTVLLSSLQLRSFIEINELWSPHWELKQHVKPAMANVY